MAVDIAPELSGNNPWSLSEKWELACGGAFARALRWSVPYSPLWGCAERAVSCTAKIPRRRPIPIFQTDSEKDAFFMTNRILPSFLTLGLAALCGCGDSNSARFDALNSQLTQIQQNETAIAQRLDALKAQMDILATTTSPGPFRPASSAPPPPNYLNANSLAAIQAQLAVLSSANSLTAERNAWIETNMVRIATDQADMWVAVQEINRDSSTTLFAITNGTLQDIDYTKSRVDDLNDQVRAIMVRLGMF
jgi:hypothetical protein